MAFNKETAKNAGEKSSRKGTPNKQTKEIRDAYRLLIEANLDNMVNWIEKISKDNPEKAIEILIKLSEYVVPKLNRTEIKDITTLEDAAKMTREERNERIEELIKKHQDNKKHQNN